MSSDKLQEYFLQYVILLTVNTSIDLLVITITFENIALLLASVCKSNKKKKVKFLNNIFLLENGLSKNKQTEIFHCYLMSIFK